MKTGQKVVADRRAIRKPRSISISDLVWGQILKRAACEGLTASKYLCSLVAADVEQSAKKRKPR